MFDTTIKDFAQVLRVPIERLLVHMQAAGLAHRDGNAPVTDSDKALLLSHLRSQYAPAPSPPPKQRPAFSKQPNHSEDLAFRKPERRGDDPVSSSKGNAAPKLFVSYSWDSPEHIEWVKSFATDLRANGIDAILDKWALHPGDPIAEWMEQSISTSDYVALVCTLDYKQKADRRKGGVGYEGSIITADLFQSANHRKYIPILRGPSWSACAPIYLHTKLYVDFRKDSDQTGGFRDLLLTLFGMRESPPPLGARPNFS